MSEAKKEAPTPEAIEVTAREQGWVPKEEFRGAEDQWRPADEFVERGKEINPILRKQNEKLTTQIEGLTGQLTDMQHDNTEQRETFKQFLDHTKGQLKKEYDGKVKELESSMREAAEAGEVEQYDVHKKELDSLEEPTEIVKEVEKKAAPAADPVFDKWALDNPWYMNNPSMRASADAFGGGLVANNHPAGEPFLDAIREQMEKMYPDEFKNSKRELPGQTEKGEKVAPTGDEEHTYENLPADAKASCDRFVKEGLLKQEDYVKEYFG